MKAVICSAFGDVCDLSFGELPEPAIQAGHMLVDVAVAGVNFPDGLIVQGKHMVQPPLPFVPGMEAAGVVVAVGDGVSGFKPGDRIVTQSGIGALGERMLARVATTFHVPGDVALDAAAAGLITYGTSYYALKDKARLQAGETLLVLGAAGGVGLAAVELGKKMNARVIAAASSTAKLELARRHGADILINYQDENLREALKTHTAGKGVDVVYDPVGGSFSEIAARSLSWGGRHLIIGFAAGDIPKLPANLYLIKNAELLGVLWGAAVKADPDFHARNIAEIMLWLASGELVPSITERYPLSEAIDALQSVMSRGVLGKVVIDVAS